ncbi:iron-sulfur cluster-binding protein [Deferribacter desulfuricans SSM1]|uniref:Iron-sulfur cluster-binding protein n=1 Tax=Deferribacter desulfuricans (strain DSM 14783 / JCM 11476 / NBRC 101012 / SSM1) TaxID=639282 RepID=D3P8V4_DEFDS|nr:ATP-binding protein [Deferribacter desulfuricans]BAI81144.1 iron-sulfur cluster-binding protein [Deferribacter desulfuricans SSM1]
MKIGVISGKGGAGKTSFAISLSELLLNKGFKVLLADLDVEEPNCNLFYNLTLNYDTVYTYVPGHIKENCTYCRECSEKCLFKALAVAKDFWMLFPELCHGCKACGYVCRFGAIKEDKREIGKIGEVKKDNFYFIEGRLNIGEVLTTALIKQVNKKINKLEKDFDFVIMDAPPGTSCPVIETVDNCDKIVVVVEDTPFGFNDYKLIHDLMAELDKSYYLVINKYIDGKEIEEFAYEKGVEVIAKIPFSKDVAIEYSKGSSILKIIKGNLEGTLKYISN